MGSAPVHTTNISSSILFIRNPLAMSVDITKGTLRAV